MIKTKKIDLIIIGALLLSALILYFGFYMYSKNFSENIIAEISVNGELYKTVSLNEDKSFIIDKIPNIKLEIKDKKIRFIESDCPDKICINTNFIGTVGQMAVCLPNKVSVKIVPANENIENYDTII